MWNSVCQFTVSRQPSSVGSLQLAVKAKRSPAIRLKNAARWKFHFKQCPMPIALCFLSMGLSLTNVKAQDPSLPGRFVEISRYTDVSNTPYMFERWKKATIVPFNGKPIENVPVNFNGESESIEAFTEDGLVELNMAHIIGVQLEQPHEYCGRQSFLKFHHKKLFNPFPLFVFIGKKYRVIKDFKVRLEQPKEKIPGQGGVYKSYSAQVIYYWLGHLDSEIQRATTKDLLKTFDEPEYLNFIKQNEIDLETESGLCRFFSWLDNK
jgi:hypothetical protein